MAVDSAGELFASLGRGTHDDLIGTSECDWLDFKMTSYPLEQSRGKWELAKDVSGFANQNGGCIVLGVQTTRESHEISDRATAIRPIRRSLINPEQYIDVIERWCYPHISGIKTHWFPQEGADALFVIEIPPQPHNRYVLVTRAVDDEGRELNAFMVCRREGSRVITLTPGEVHRLIADGLRSVTVTAPTTPQIGQDAADAVVDDLERAQQWEGGPTYFLQAIPTQNVRLHDFYDRDGPRGALKRFTPVRGKVAGFNLRILDDVDIHNGSLEYLTDSRRAIRIDPSGLFTVGFVATYGYLGWGMESSVTPGTSEIWLNSIALVESTVEFFRFLEAEISSAAESPTRWRVRVLCRRFDRGPVCLRGGVPAQGLLPMLNVPSASAPNWDREVIITGDAEMDSFSALREFYALFGQPESAIPFHEKGRISFHQLAKV